MLQLSTETESLCPHFLLKSLEAGRQQLLVLALSTLPKTRFSRNEFSLASHTPRLGTCHPSGAVKSLPEDGGLHPALGKEDLRLADRAVAGEISGDSPRDAPKNLEQIFF